MPIGKIVQLQKLITNPRGSLEGIPNIQTKEIVSPQLDQAFSSIHLNKQTKKKWGRGEKKRERKIEAEPGHHLYIPRGSTNDGQQHCGVMSFALE